MWLEIGALTGDWYNASDSQQFVRKIFVDCDWFMLLSRAAKMKNLSLVASMAVYREQESSCPCSCISHSEKEGTEMALFECVLEAVLRQGN